MWEASAAPVPAAEAPAVETRGLSFRYPSRQAFALRRVDLTVRPGESLLVLGPSGSGKSTLTLTLDGLIPQVVEGDMEGTVAVAGLVTRDHPVHELSMHAGLVFQDPEAQFCTMTVADEVAFGLENLRIPARQIESAIDAVLDAVGLAGFRERSLETLSGGEKQRVALASVLAFEPSILVLDEPSANLDPTGTAELFALLAGLKRAGQHTIVIIEHKLDDLMSWVDRVLVLAGDGSVLAQGNPREIFYERAEDLRAAGEWRPRVADTVLALRSAGWAVPGLPLTPAETRDALAATPGLVERLRSDGRTTVATEPEPQCGGELFRVDGLDFRYPGAGGPALRDVSLRIEQGEFLAVVGANGAGKSTLAALMAGVLTPPPGTILLEGRDVRTLSSRDLAGRVGYVFQNPEHQFVTERVYDELAFSLTGRAGRRLGDEQDRLVRSWLDRFGLARLAEENPFSLSQGQKRRLSVAAMLIRGQQAVILDEPTFGQDRAQTAQLLGLLAELGREGRTLVVLTHDMELVASHARTLLVLSGGEVLYHGPPRPFFADEDLVRAARLAVPTVGAVAAQLGAGRLLTAADVVSAASRPDGA